MQAKMDSRPRRGAWAPGTYICECFRCHQQFMGDKRAGSCADCAYRPADPVPASLSVEDDGPSVTITLTRRADGGLRVHGEPPLGLGLILSGELPGEVIARLWPALHALKHPITKTQ